MKTRSRLKLAWGYDYDWGYPQVRIGPKGKLTNNPGPNDTYGLARFGIEYLGDQRALITVTFCLKNMVVHPLDMRFDKFMRETLGLDGEATDQSSELNYTIELSKEEFTTATIRIARQFFQAIGSADSEQMVTWFEPIHVREYFKEHTWQPYGNLIREIHKLPEKVFVGGL